jgi:hypothetical protein
MTKKKKIIPQSYLSYVEAAYERGQVDKYTLKAVRSTLGHTPIIHPLLRIFSRDNPIKPKQPTRRIGFIFSKNGTWYQR